MQPASHNEETDLAEYAANNRAEINHLIDSMNKAHDRRDKCQKQADHLSAHIAELEANLTAVKQQAAVAQADVQAANTEYGELNHQSDIWEQQLKAVVTILHNAKRRRTC